MFIPYADDTPRYRIQYVTLGLIVVNALVFFLTLSLKSNDAEYVKYLLKYSSLGSGIDHEEIQLGLKMMSIPEAHGGFSLIRAVTSGFLHADFLHLAGNMWFLFLFGGAVEGKLGHLRMGLTYLVCLILSDLAQHVFDPNFTFGLGASGAVGGMVGAYWFLFCRAQILFFYWLFLSVYGTVALTVHWAVIWLFGWDVVMWILASKIHSDIAHSAHVGGLLCGLLCGLGLRQFSHMTLDGEDMLTRFVLWRARKKRGAAYFENSQRRAKERDANIPEIAPSLNDSGAPQSTAPVPPPPKPPESTGPKTLDF